MALWQWLKSISLAKLMVEIAAIIGILVLGFFVVIIGSDQFRHWVDPDYAENQRIKRDFLCFQQRGVAPQDPDALLRLQFEVETLMDAARQQLAPTDFVGKLQKLGLCAEFNAISAGGLQFIDPAKSLQDRQRLGAFARGGANPVQRRLEEVEMLVKVLPDFPADIHDQATVRLNEMLALYEAVVAPIPVEAIVVVEPDTPVVVGEAPTPPADERWTDDVWLLFVGGDQTDEAALDQVRRTNQILADEGLAGTIGPAELYLIRSWRRTVIPFPDRASAQDALNTLIKKLPYGGYIRSRAAECEDLAEQPALNGTPVTRCQL